MQHVSSPPSSSFLPPPTLPLPLPRQVFTYKWSVNWAFLPEPTFLSWQLAAGLLFLHLRLLWTLANKSWLRGAGGLWPALRAFFSRRAGDATDAAYSGSTRKGGKAAKGRGAPFEDAVLFFVFSANFAGILCSRTIHYQFYSW